MIPILRIPIVDSTNRLLREWLESGQASVTQEGALLVADEQTSGRGQAGNSWEAAAGQNITCSLAFRPDFLPRERHFLLSEAVALGVKAALDEAAAEVGGLAPFAIKWPNDIFWGDRKIAGILIENQWMDRHIAQSIVGIGVNINQIEWVTPHAVSLRQLLGTPIETEAVLEKMHRHIMLWYSRLKARDFSAVAEAYARALYRREGFFPYKEPAGAPFLAQIERVADDGFLYLRTEEGEVRRYAFKEVGVVIEG
jgi:BirA family biotin operon repressor/biotin-[acetyl-CoA-carboxylase] ligase